MNIVSGKSTEYIHEAARQDLSNYVDYPDYAFGTTGNDPKHLQVKTESYAYHLLSQAAGWEPDKAKLLNALTSEVADLTRTPDTNDIELLSRVKTTVTKKFPNDTLDANAKNSYDNLVGTLDNVINRLNEMRQKEFENFENKISQPLSPRSGASSSGSSISDETAEPSKITADEIARLKKIPTEIKDNLDFLKLALETGDQDLLDQFHQELVATQKNLAILLDKIPEDKRTGQLLKLAEDNRLLDVYLRTITAYAKFKSNVNIIKTNLEQRQRSGLDNDQTQKMKKVIEDSKETDKKYRALIGKTLFGHTIERISFAAT